MKIPVKQVSLNEFYLIKLILMELTAYFPQVCVRAPDFKRDMDAVKNRPMKNENIQRCAAKAETSGGSAPFGNPFWRSLLPLNSTGNKPSGKPRRECSSVMSIS
ncbi:MAG: hypothetical protein EA344_07740 [Alkalicoccus sp.]|nr:MAG: hypothetical protein EA344_07740 [Alkalicoccus sp.]